MAIVASISGEMGGLGTKNRRYTTQEDWEERISHLENVHKFGACDQSKIFVCADNFRRHINHSHAGTSGQWTNALENACMRKEEIARTWIRGAV